MSSGEVNIQTSPQTPAEDKPTPGVITSLQAGADGTVDLGSALEYNVEPETRPYSVARARENIRGIIALGLIALLSTVVVISLILIWVHPDRSKELHELLVLVFGPLIALVGSATGFYFGSKEKETEAK
jgi:hypothetical protein